MNQRRWWIEPTELLAPGYAFVRRVLRSVVDSESDAEAEWPPCIPSSLSTGVAVTDSDDKLLLLVFGDGDLDVEDVRTTFAGRRRRRFGVFGLARAALSSSIESLSDNV